MFCKLPYFYQIQGLLGHQNDIVLCVWSGSVGKTGDYFVSNTHHERCITTAKQNTSRPCTYAMESNGSIHRGYPAKRALSAMRIAWRLGPFWQDTLDINIDSLRAWVLQTTTMVTMDSTNTLQSKLNYTRLFCAWNISTLLVIIIQNNFGNEKRFTSTPILILCVLPNEWLQSCHFRSFRFLILTHSNQARTHAMHLI